MRGDRDDDVRLNQAVRAAAHRADTYVLGEDELRAELRDMLAGDGPLTGGPLLGLPPLEDDYARPGPTTFVGGVL